MRKSMQESNENAKIRKSAQNANSDFKYKRILQLYTRLLKGEVINKAKEAAAANVTERSIQRDLDDLRAFFDEQAANGKDSYELVYSRKEHIVWANTLSSVRWKRAVARLWTLLTCVLRLSTCW